MMLFVNICNTYNIVVHIYNESHMTAESQKVFCRNSKAFRDWWEQRNSAHEQVQFGHVGIKDQLGCQVVFVCCLRFLSRMVLMSRSTIWNGPERMMFMRCFKGSQRSWAKLCSKRASRVLWFTSVGISSTQLWPKHIASTRSLLTARSVPCGWLKKPCGLQKVIFIARDRTLSRRDRCDFGFTRHDHSILRWSFLVLALGRGGSSAPVAASHSTARPSGHCFVGSLGVNVCGQWNLGNLHQSGPVAGTE